MNKLVSILLFSVLPLLASARTIGDFFVSETGNVFTLLEQSDRMDMVDYYESGQKVNVSNVMDGKSSIDTLTTDFMKVKIADAHEVAMRLYPEGKSDTLIVVIETFKVEVPDSKIRVFDTNWNELELKSVFKMPQMEDFLVKNLNKNQKKEALSYVEFPLVKLEFAADGGITATSTVLETLGKDEQEKLKPCLLDSLHYRYAGNKFKLVK